MTNEVEITGATVTVKKMGRTRVLLGAHTPDRGPEQGGCKGGCFSTTLSLTSDQALQLGLILIRCSHHPDPLKTAIDLLSRVYRDQWEWWWSKDERDQVAQLTGRNG